MLYPLDDPALLGIPPMSYHCRLIDVTWTDDNDNWPEDVRLIFSLSFPLSPSLPPSLFSFLNLQMHSYSHCVITSTCIHATLSLFLSLSLPFFILLYIFSLSLSLSLSLPLQVCEWFHETAIDLKKNLLMTILPAVRTEQDIIPVTLKDDTLQNIGQLMIIQSIAR